MEAKKQHGPKPCVFFPLLRILTSLFYTHYYYTSDASFPLHGIEYFNVIFDFVWLMSLRRLHYIALTVYVLRRLCIYFPTTCYFTFTEPGSLIFLYCDVNSVPPQYCWPITFHHSVTFIYYKL